MSTVHRSSRTRSLLVVTVGLLVVGLLAGCRGGSGESRAAGPDPTSAGLLTIPAWDPADGGTTTAIEAGTYLVPRSPWSVADFTATFPDGWSVQYGHVYATSTDAGDEIGFYPVVVDEVFTDSCAPEDESRHAVGPAVRDLYAALEEQAGGASVSEPVTTTLGGYPATRIDLEVPRRLDVTRCRMGPAGLQIWYSEPADKYFVLLRDATASVYVVDVDGRRQVFLAQVGRSASAADRAELSAVLDSIHLEGGAPETPPSAAPATSPAPSIAHV